MSRPAVERLFFWISALPTLFVLAACLQRDSFLPTTIPERARMLASDREFEFIGWTVDALWWKTAQFTLGEERYLSPAAWHSQVIRYNALIDSIHRNEDELKRIFADPAVADPMAATAELRTRIAEARSQQSQRQARIESILEQEVASEIRRQGFSFGGEVFPPVLFHFTPLPKMLILSPRDTIRQEATVQLVPDFTLEEEIALERKEEARLGVSALVVPLGGLGTFPTMIMENTWTNWVLEAISHEWVHNYLAFTPLGLNYETSGEMRTINETAASIAGKRLGAGILARFYPELLPPPASGKNGDTPMVLPPDEPPAFDFNREMHETRVETDRLLAEGKIAEAEAYMEARRHVFVDHGYAIRRLNQAYFAFYGAYADTPGERGEDPVGPAVEAFFAKCPDVGAFIRAIAAVTSFAQLQEMIRTPGSCR